VPAVSTSADGTPAVWPSRLEKVAPSENVNCASPANGPPAAAATVKVPAESAA